MSFETNFREHLTWGCLTGVLYGAICSYINALTIRTVLSWDLRTMLVLMTFYMLHVQGSIQPDLDLNLSIKSWPKVKKTWMSIAVGLSYVHFHLFGSRCVDISTTGAGVAWSLTTGCVIAGGLHLTYLISQTDLTWISKVVKFCRVVCGIVIGLRFMYSIYRSGYITEPLDGQKILTVIVWFESGLSSLFVPRILTYGVAVWLQYMCLSDLHGGTHRKSTFHSTSFWSGCNFIALILMDPAYSIRNYDVYAVVPNVLYFNSFGVLNHLLLDHLGSIFTRKFDVNVFYQMIAAIVLTGLIALSFMIYTA